MKVVVYVEGPSDVAAMRGLFSDLLVRKRGDGIAIEFAESPPGDKKKTLLTKVPLKAVDILMGQPDFHVVVVPDLYPRNHPFPHETFEELREGVNAAFLKAMERKNVADNRLLDRFHVFCFKYDLEVLMLAAREQLARRLGTSSFKLSWTDPVEDQDHGRPPKYVVRDLFKAHDKHYKETVDAPLILAAADYRVLAQRCPQCFSPFVEFLTSLPKLS